MLRTTLIWTLVVAGALAASALALNDRASQPKDGGKKRYRLVMRQDGQLIIRDTVVDAGKYSPEQFARDNGAREEVSVHELSAEQAAIVKEAKARVLDLHSDMLESEDKNVITKVVIQDDKGNVDCKMTINGKEVDCKDHLMVPSHPNASKHIVRKVAGPGDIIKVEDGAHQERVVIIRNGEEDHQIAVDGDSTRKVVIHKNITRTMDGEDLDIDIRIEGMEDLDALIKEQLEGLPHMLKELKVEMEGFNLDSLMELHLSQDSIIELKKHVSVFMDSLDFDMEGFKAVWDEMDVEVMTEKLRMDLKGMDSLFPQVIRMAHDVRIDGGDGDFAVVIVSPVDGQKDESSARVEFVDMRIYPNPSDGQVNLELTAQASKKLSVTVMDLNGKKAFSERIKPFDGHYSKKLDLSDWSSGTYVVEFDTGKERFVERFVVK